MQTPTNQPVKLVADVTVISGDKVLLVKYTDTNKYDHQSGWFLPDDLVNYGEHPDDTITRIAKEQLGLDSIKPGLSFIESFTGNDKSWHLVFHYKAEIKDTSRVNTSGDILESQWFGRNSLPNAKEVAHHGWALYTLDEILK